MDCCTFYVWLIALMKVQQGMHFDRVTYNSAINYVWPIFFIVIITVWFCVKKMKNLFYIRRRLILILSIEITKKGSSYINRIQSRWKPLHVFN